ncbi:hypothetical protein ACF06P_39810 [Streptomyces sp. NPDC015684]|uniref:hypothetical protein n=1 Tax=unclassified Streptomyces TaxID=2593676 RepID=UPI0036FE69C8
MRYETRAGPSVGPANPGADGDHIVVFPAIGHVLPTGTDTINAERLGSTAGGDGVVGTAGADGTCGMSSFLGLVQRPGNGGSGGCGR